MRFYTIIAAMAAAFSLETSAVNLEQRHIDHAGGDGVFHSFVTEFPESPKVRE